MEGSGQQEMFHTNISQSEFDLNAGATGAATITISSSVGSSYQLSIDGPIDKKWYSIPVGDVWVDGGGKGQLEVIFQPPMDVPPGDNVYSCQVVITPLTGGDAVRHTVRLTVRGAPGPSCNVIPLRRSGKESTYKVTVLNTLPFDVTVGMTARDQFTDNPKGGCKYYFDRQTFRLYKNSSEDVSLTARPKRRPWFGLTSGVDFKVEATPDSQMYKPAVAESKAYVSPAPPWWLVTLILIALVFGAWKLLQRGPAIEDFAKPQGKLVLMVTPVELKYDKKSFRVMAPNGKPIGQSIGKTYGNDGEVSFGQVPIDTQAERRFVIRNDWPKTGDPSFLLLRQPVITGDQGFEVVQISDDPMHPQLPESLNPQQSHFFVVRFRPTQKGKVKASLLLINSAKWEDNGQVIDRRHIQISLTGEGK